jgi:hypothetical protein
VGVLEKQGTHVTLSSSSSSSPNVTVEDDNRKGKAPLNREVNNPFED